MRLVVLINAGTLPELATCACPVYLIATLPCKHPTLLYPTLPFLDAWCNASIGVLYMLQVRDHIQTINLAPIDTYFMLNCFNNTAQGDGRSGVRLERALSSAPG